MARAFRSTFSLLSVSVFGGVLAAACGGGDDQGQTTNSTTGGATFTTPGVGGGKTGGAAAIGGSKATGGKSGNGGASSVGGTSTAGGSSATPTGGKSSVGGTSTAGGSAAVGGASTAAGGTTTAGGSAAVGGQTGAGGTSTAGGTTAAGGTSAAGGTTTAGGSSATGGKTGAGGTSTAGGTSATGGSSATATGGTTSAGGGSATGGTSALAACPVDDATSDPNFNTTTAFCRPANADLTLVSGQLSVSTLNINATNGQITLTGTVPFTGNLALSPPFNAAPCASSGLDAEVANSNPAVAYTGITLAVANALSTPTTLVLYLADRITSGGVSYYAIATAPIDVPANGSVTKTLKWSDLTLNCSAGTGFDLKQILAIGLGFNQTGSVNLTITNVTFSTT